MLEHYRPHQFIEVFSGGGRGQDVAQELGYTHSMHLDFNTGWNAVADEIPSGSDFIFSHPPYADMINYQEYNGNHTDDLSLLDYDSFIKALDKVNAKIYQSLVNGGRHAMLIGDMRRKGRYYSMIKDLAWIGDIDAHLIKAQYNMNSNKKTYGGTFIPITHEHLLVFRKNQVWKVPITLVQQKSFDLKAFENLTWRDLIQGALDSLGGKSDLSSIYELIAPSKKAQNNDHWKEKVRQTLQRHENFVPEARGHWQLKIA